MEGFGYLNLSWKINLKLRSESGYGFKVYTDGFAILWDESYDARVLDTIEKLSELDLLKHVVLIQNCIKYIK
jgi:hypothetical protein